ncbi:MAG: hypothetical protein ACP5U1_03950 [Desulfomonilaceae bacterium]
MKMDRKIILITPCVAGLNHRKKKLLNDNFGRGLDLELDSPTKNSDDIMEFFSAKTPGSLATLNLFVQFARPLKHHWMPNKNPATEETRIINEEKTKGNELSKRSKASFGTEKGKYGLN